jgi:hypothetical protein
MSASNQLAVWNITGTNGKRSDRVAALFGHGKTSVDPIYANAIIGVVRDFTKPHGMKDAVF